MALISFRKKQHLVFNTVRDLYLHLDLPVDDLDEKVDFAIHNLKDIHFEFPYSSPVFRPNFFSFVFVKDALGKYTIDDLSFDTVPGMIYFSNPGHYKSYIWEEISESYLITLSEAFLKENVHPDIFREFPFLLAGTIKPRIFQPEAFAEFESIYLQISREYVSDNPYRKRVMGKLFIVILWRIKEHFWNDYDLIYIQAPEAGMAMAFKRILTKILNLFKNGWKWSC